MSGLNRKTAGLKLKTFYVKFIRVNSTEENEKFRKLLKVCFKTVVSDVEECSFKALLDVWKYINL